MNSSSAPRNVPTSTSIPATAATSTRRRQDAQEEEQNEEYVSEQLVPGAYAIYPERTSHLEESCCVTTPSEQELQDAELALRLAQGDDDLPGTGEHGDDLDRRIAQRLQDEEWARQRYLQQHQSTSRVLDQSRMFRLQAFAVEEYIEADGVAAVMSEAEEEEAHQQRQKRMIRCLAYLLCIVIIAAIIPTILKTGLGGDKIIMLNNSEAPSSAPSSSPTTNRFAEVSDMVKLWYADDEMYGEVFGDENSSQFKAAEWLANEDPLQLDMSHPRLLNRYVLATFYFATIGDEWDRCGRKSTRCNANGDWLSSSNECNWFMIHCEENTHTITEFRLPPRTRQETAGFAGTLPFDVALLPGLHTLLLSGEEIGGSIPQSWSRLPSLENFWLGDNSLTGTFPEFLVTGNPSLVRLDLWGNMLEGPLPTLLSSDTLKVLSFNNNSLNGTLSPGLFSGLPALTYVDLELNNLEGVIPTEIYSLVNLGTLYLGQNAFEGVLTDDIANLSKLKELGLGRTQLSGSLPSGLFDITGLKTLGLAKANFIGQLPETFSNLKSLQELYLNDNHFSGPIPTAFDEMDTLHEIKLHGNDLTGAISDTLCERKGQRFFEIRNITVDCDELVCPAGCCDNCNA